MTVPRRRPALTHLALEVRDLDRAARFYADRLGLVPTERNGTELAFDVGGTNLVCRRPTSVPRGGLHVHFAFETTGREYPSWRARFADAEEVSFGSFRSVYPFDADGHCPEIAGVADGGQGLVGLFEVVLEVANVDAAERAYRALGFETVDRGIQRRRVRLRGPIADDEDERGGDERDRDERSGDERSGDGRGRRDTETDGVADAPRPFDLELWEPQLGLAGARGGVHVDFGVRITDPAAAAERAFGDLPSVRALERDDGSVELYDPDGHHLVLRPA